MRKIERLMNDAIRGNRHWKCDNTEVIADHDGVSRVYLHDNLIAEVGDTFIRLFDGGWQSATTKSRLNAILADHGIGSESVFQKNHTWFFRDAMGDVLPFFSGMRLN